MRVQTMSQGLRSIRAVHATLLNREDTLSNATYNGAFQFNAETEPWSTCDGLGYGSLKPRIEVKSSRIAYDTVNARLNPWLCGTGIGNQVFREATLRRSCFLKWGLSCHLDQHSNQTLVSPGSGRQVPRGLRRLICLAFGDWYCKYRQGIKCDLDMIMHAWDHPRLTPSLPHVDKVIKRWIAWKWQRPPGCLEMSIFIPLAPCW